MPEKDLDYTFIMEDEKGEFVFQEWTLEGLMKSLKKYTDEFTNERVGCIYIEAYRKSEMEDDGVY